MICVFILQWYNFHTNYNTSKYPTYHGAPRQSVKSRHINPFVAYITRRYDLFDALTLRHTDANMENLITEFNDGLSDNECSPFNEIIRITQADIRDWLTAPDTVSNRIISRAAKARRRHLATEKSGREKRRETSARPWSLIHFVVRVSKRNGVVFSCVRRQ